MALLFGERYTAQHHIFGKQGDASGPRYSPNFNLIERLWGLVKSKCLRNSYYEDFDSFRQAIDGFLDSLQERNRELLKSLITENFHISWILKT